MRCVAAKTQPVELGRLRPQTSLDVTQTFPPGQLCERKTAKLIEAGETLDLALTVIAIHAATERRQREMIHDLGKDILTLRHGGKPRDQRNAARCHQNDFGIETRTKSLFYSRSQRVRLVRELNVGTLVAFYYT